MNTIAWLLVLSGALLLRQVSTGRAGNIREDFSAGLTSFLEGDWAKLSEVSARRGENITPIEPLPTDGTSTPIPTSDSAGSVIAKMRELAAAANYRYGWGKTGPNSYDCSGLVYVAMRDLGIYNGVRFTTQTFPLFAAKVVDPVNGPQIGDIVLWQKASGGHMGIVTGNDRMFSALSTLSGIKESAISATTKQKGVQPTYWRITDG